jgi:hypothetical protein
VLSEFGFGLRLIFAGSGWVEVRGDRCDDAANRIGKLATEHYVTELLALPPAILRHPHKAFRPWVEVTMTSEFTEMQSLDPGMCVLTKHKV